MKRFFRVDKGKLRRVKDAYDTNKEGYLAFARDSSRIPLEELVLAGFPYHFQLRNLSKVTSYSDTFDEKHFDGWYRALTSFYKGDDILFVVGKCVMDERGKSLIFPVLPVRRIEEGRRYKPISEARFYQASGRGDGIYYEDDLLCQEENFPRARCEGPYPRKLLLVDEPFVVQGNRVRYDDNEPRDPKRERELWKDLLKSKVIEGYRGADQIMIGVVGGMTYDPSTFYICAGRFTYKSKR